MLPGLRRRPTGVGTAPPHGDAELVGRAWEPDGHTGEGLRYWRDALAGGPPETRMFAGPDQTGRDETGPDQPSPTRASVRFDHADLWELARLCAAERATTFTALLAALACLVGRYAGQRDVVIGAPVSLRADAEQANLVGLLINTLPLRIRLHPGATYRAVLRQSRDVLLDALEHRRVPLYQIVDALGATRALDASPLFQVLLAHQREPALPDLPGLRASARPVDAAAAKYGLTVTATEGADGLEVAFEADRRHCAPADLVAAVRHFAILVRAVGQHPDRPVDAIDLLGAAERDAALRRAAGPRVTRPATVGVAALVAAAARATPAAIAATVELPGGGTSQLSYAALYQRAAALAGRLVELGAGTDRPVGVLQRRGLGMPVSYLAALLSGGAVLPLEPDDPDARLARLIGDAAVGLVVTHRALLPRCAALGVAAIAVEDVLTPTVEPTGVPAAPVHPEQAAYVIHTSGSTGVPKGIVIPQRGLVNRLEWMRQTLPAAAAERVLAKTPISFDVSVSELFGPLVAGGCLVLAEPGGERDPRYLARLIAREQVGATHFVPSMLAPFLATLEADGLRLPTLHTVACSGEALPAEAVRRAGRVLDATLYNMYGPAEASIEVSWWPCDPTGARPVSIGWPIANVECRVLDDRLRPVPGGTAGELCLGGDCLARGYLGRPAGTAAAFVPAPDANPGARLYRSGDFARVGPAGAIDIIGRRDHQVKILGRRVELGEVTAALRGQPGIRDAAVVMHGDRLAAFVVLAPDGAPDLPDLLAALRTQLPGYLVPALVELLPGLPTTVNGKTDLAELARRAGRLVPVTGASAGPRNDLERQLVDAWRSVLEVPQIGIDERFFDAGGNSLSLLRLHHRLAATLAPELTVRDLFRFPTVAALAAHLAAAAPAGADSPGAAEAARAVARGQRRRTAAGRPTGRTERHGDG